MVEDQLFNRGIVSSTIHWTSVRETYCNIQCTVIFLVDIYPPIEQLLADLNYTCRLTEKPMSTFIQNSKQKQPRNKTRQDTCR